MAAPTACWSRRGKLRRAPAAAGEQADCAAGEPGRDALGQEEQDGDGDGAEEDHLQVLGAARRLGHDHDEGGAQDGAGDAADAADHGGDHEVDGIGQ